MVAIKISKFILPLMFLLSVAIPIIGSAKASPKHYADEILQAETLGKIIYDKDIAAWVGTDNMLADLGNDVSGLPIQGWVTDIDEGRYRVNFLGEKNGEAKIYYQAWVKGKKVEKTVTFTQGIPLTPSQMAMWTARQLALKQKFKRCSNNYNTVVVPYEHAGEKKLYVYLFASTTDPLKAVFGGHYRYSMSSDGTEVKNHIAFTNSCIAIDKKQVPGSSSLEAMMITHLKSNYPQEHHVFIALSHGVPVLVSAAHTNVVYNISLGKIRVVEN